MAWTKAARDAAAAKRRGTHLSAATRAKIAASKKGKKRSSSTRTRISAAQKGKKHPHKGHVISAATRAKLSKAMKGRKTKGHPMSAATRKKIGSSLKGRKHPHKGVKGPHHWSHGVKGRVKRQRLKRGHHFRRNQGMTNEAILNQRQRRLTRGRKHSQSNRGVLRHIHRRRRRT